MASSNDKKKRRFPSYSNFLPRALSNMQLSGKTPDIHTDFPYLQLEYTGKMQHPPFSLLEPLLLYEKDGYQVIIKKNGGSRWVLKREDHWHPGVYTVNIAVVAKANEHNTLKYSFDLSAKDLPQIPSPHELWEKDQNVLITGGPGGQNALRISSTGDPSLYRFVTHEGRTQVVMPRFLFACIQESVARIVKYTMQKAMASTTKVVYKGVSERLTLDEFVTMAYAHGILRQMYCNFLRDRGMECGEFVLDYPSVVAIPREMRLFLTSNYFQGVRGNPTKIKTFLENASREYLRACVTRTLRECAKKAELDIYILHGVDPDIKFWEIWRYMLLLTARLNDMFNTITTGNEIAGAHSPMISIMRTVDLNNLCPCLWEQDEDDVFYTELYTYGEYGENPVMRVSLDWGL